MAIFILIVLLVISFAIVGAISYESNDVDEKYYGSFSNAVWNSFVLLTTANFPDIMMKEYKDEQLWCIVYISYLTLGHFFLVNLIIAVFFNSYRMNVQSVINKFIKKKVAEDN